MRIPSAILLLGVFLLGCLSLGGISQINPDIGGSTDLSAIETALSDRVVWKAGELDVDGVQCASPAAVTINSGPLLKTILCADNDASTIYGWHIMSDAWDGDTITFELSYVQTAADTSALASDISAQCVPSGSAITSSWGTEVAIDDAAVSGSNKIDMTESAAVTPSGVCEAGAALFWRWQMDAAGTTTAVGTLHFLGVKMRM